MKGVIGSSGTSLVELLVGLLLLALIGGALHQFCRSMLRGVLVLEVATEAQEAARIGVQQMTRDLRGAGFGLDTSLRGGICLAATDAVEIESDLNGDGDTADANEAIGYSLNRGTRTLMRSMGHAPPQPMIPDVAADGLLLAYVDGDGAPVPMADGSVEDGVRERIRRIDIAFRVEIKHPDPAYTQPIRAIETATVALRNR